MVLLVLLVLGCTDPTPVAVSACQAMPGISARAGDLPMFEPLLSAKDMKVLREAAPTLGLQAVDETRMAELRSKTTCMPGEANGAGDGRWAIELTRTAPVVNPDGSLGDPVETTFEWQVVDQDGGRVDLNLEGAAIARRNLEDAVHDADWHRFASGWKALAARWNDPVLPVDIQAAESKRDRMDYTSRLKNVFDAAGEGLIHGTVTNSGEQAVSRAMITATFESAGGPLTASTQIGALAPGQSLTYTVDIPEGAEGNVKLKTTDLEFAPAPG